MPVAPPGGTLNCQYSVAPLTYSIYAGATTSNWLTAFPASNSYDLARPRRVAKTNNLATTRIAYDLSATTAIEAFSIENTNLDDIFIQGSNDGGSWTDIGTYTLDSTDPDDGRKKLLCIPTTTTEYRYIRIGPNTAITSDDHYEIGIFGMWGALKSLEKNFATPYEKTLLDDAPTIDFESGGREVGLPSPIRIQFALQARMERMNAVALDQYREIAQYPRDRVMLLYENMDDLTAMYHVRRSGSFRLTRTENATITVSGIQLLEVA